MSRIDSVTFAYYLLQQAGKYGVEMNATKLQKLLYAVDGVLLAQDIDVIDEHCKAWEFGPVYPKVYKKISNPDIRSYAQGFSTTKITNHEKYAEIRDTVQEALKTLGRLSAARLSAWSHIDGSPWYQTDIYTDISKDTMKKYFNQVD